MNVMIRGENINITPELEAYVESKLSKLERYLPNINDVYVELSSQRSTRGPDVVSAQITLRHSRGAILRTEEKMDQTDQSTVRSALLAASDKMYRRIRRFKEKPRSKRMREKYTITPEELLLAEPMPEEEDELADAPPADELEPQVIRRKQVGVSAMNEEEAIEQMELLGHTFFIFFDVDSNSMNVVYKRRGGGYGVLEPQVE